MNDLKKFFATTTGKVASVIIVFGVGILMGTNNSSKSQPAEQPQDGSVQTPIAANTTTAAPVTSTSVKPARKKTTASKPVPAASSSPQTQTPASSPTPAPIPNPVLTWHTAYTYSNNVNIKTPPFTMKGSKWRVTYSCSTNPDVAAQGMSGNFYGYIYSADNGYVATNFASFVDCPKSDTSYVYAQSPGQYYLDLMSPSSSYTVTVEDYY